MSDARTRFIAQFHLKKVADTVPARRSGMVTFPFDLIGRRIAVDGWFEAEELEALRNHVFPRLPGRRVCLDIGANIGNHSLFFSESFDRVIAFEPHPRTFRLLQLNAELAGNITAIEAGLSSSTRSARVAVVAGNIGMSRVADASETATAGELTFPLMRLDDIDDIRNLPSIDFVKIDVEGHEAEAIEGGRETLSRHKPCIALEVLVADIESGSTRAIDLLRGMGYAHTYILRSQRPFAKAPKPVARLAVAFLGLVFGVRPAKRFVLEETTSLARENHSVVLVSTVPLI